MKKIVIFHNDSVVSDKILDAVAGCTGFSAIFLSNAETFSGDIQKVKPDLFIAKTNDFRELITNEQTLKVCSSGSLKIVLIGDVLTDLPSDLKSVISVLPDDFTPHLLKELLMSMMRDCYRKIHSGDHLDWIVQHIPTAIFWKDKDLRYMGCNKVFADDWGLNDIDEVVGLSDFELFSQEKATENIAQDRKVLSSGEPIINCEENHTNRNGKKEWLRKSKIPMQDENGEIIGVLGMYEKITEKKQAEADLLKEKHFLQMLMDNIPDTIYFKNTKSQFIRVNKAQALLIGESNPEGAIGKTDADYFDPRHAAKALADEQRILETGKPIVNKLERLFSTNKERFVTATKIPLRNGSGEITGLVGISRDVTREHRYEELLKQQQDLVDAFLRNSPDIIFYKDRKARYTRVNDAHARLLKLKSPAEAVGKTDFDFHEKEFAERSYHDDMELMRTGVAIIDKLQQFRDNSGKLRYVTTTKIPVREKSGRIIGLVGISRDYTERKKMENRLEHERYLLQILMDSFPDYIYFKDVHSRFIRMNRAQCQKLGMQSAEEAIGKTDFDFLPENEAREFYNDELKLLKTGKPLINKVEKLSNSDGTSRWMSATKIPIRDIEGNIVGLVGISRDITKEEEAKINLRLAKSQAEEANKAKSLFLANMSHEIRTPMNGVIGMADIMKKTNLDAEQHEYLDVIIKSGNNLLSIINDILDFSKIESGRMELESTPINIRRIIEDVADILILKANNKGIDLVTYIDSAIPANVLGDPVRLRQVLVNLANNAVKFTDKGEVFISAELKRVDDQHEVLFKVKDTGIGIPLEAQSKLFDSFTQVDSSTTRKYGGTGLGLAISKRLSEQMGGEIGIASKPGEGSIFWFTARFDKTNSSETDVIPAEILELEDVKVLIVDDNRTNRFIFSKYLETWDCHSEEAKNGKIGIQKLRNAVNNGDPYDIVLVDYQMSEMDGLEFARCVKEDPLIASVKLILLSSVSDILPQGKVRSAGFEYYLNKPVKLEQLKQILLKVMGPVPEVNMNKNTDRTGNGQSSLKKQNLKVLLAEDNLINQKVAMLTLKCISDHIDLAENGEEALEMYHNDHYDLIMMDIQMPLLNGYEVTKKIREEEAESDSEPVKIVAMTANAMPEDVDLCLSIGMDAYLSKPFKSEDVVTTVSKLFNS